ncbi:hypothetical protein [Crassaminicella indica]|nr:hypothetical protein [Crassaminicella indica]
MLTRTINQSKIMIVIGMMILIGQRIAQMINHKSVTPIGQMVPGILAILLVCMLSLKIKELLPNLKFPAFAWATLIALILSMPFMPTAKIFLQYTNNVNFLATTTPILAFAGISVGNKIDQLKKISWKLVIISIAVFIGTYFGSALVAQMILKMQGII